MHLLLHFCLRKDNIPIHTLPIANVEGSIQLVELSRSLSLLAIEIPKEAAVVASSEHLEDAQGSAWAHCSANVNLIWALAGAASFSFACSLSVILEWASGLSVICWKGCDVYRISKGKRKVGRRGPQVLLLASCAEDWGRWVTSVCLSFSACGRKDAHHLVQPPRPIEEQWYTSG